MAVGDVFSAKASKAQNEYLDIQPAAGQECVIHTIYHEAECELYLYDGSTAFLFDSDTTGGAWYGLSLHVTNALYIRIKQTNAASKEVGYDGIETKAAA